MDSVHTTDVRCLFDFDLLYICMKYLRLRALQRQSYTHYFYEATVGAGLPIISTLRGLLETGDKIQRIEGILRLILYLIFWDASRKCYAVKQSWIHSRFWMMFFEGFAVEHWAIFSTISMEIKPLVRLCLKRRLQVILNQILVMTSQAWMLQERLAYMNIDVLIIESPRY